MSSLEAIRKQLQAHVPRLVENSDRQTRAAVALLLRQGQVGPELLFIERAKHENDPWSGDLGFPGGRLESRDPDARSAAERETAEEIGLELKAQRYLGRLDDLTGAYLPIVVSCFVYAVEPAPAFELNHEVADYFWIPLSLLCDPRRHGEKTVYFRGETMHRPAIDLLGPGRRVLWGITYRLVISFLGLLNWRPDENTGGEGT